MPDDILIDPSPAVRDRHPRLAILLREVGQSYLKARQKHAPMRGAHEGYAVILEELDELWAEVKRWQPEPDEISHTITNAVAWEAYRQNMRDMRKEALHVAAMALAFLIEVTDE